MLGKRPRPMIGKLSELLVSRGRTVALLNTTGSVKLQSPRGLKNYDLGGVGLGIVVALDNSKEHAGREVMPKHAVCTSNLKTHGHEFDVEEEYTCVTCHLPNKTFTKVYYDGGEGHVRNINKVGVLTRTLIDPKSSYPTSNFLSSCHLCGKKLHGKDIYMYRGEKAFCSPECRSSQIMMDESKERCSTEASRSVELSSSPYTTTREQIFSTGILAL